MPITTLSLGLWLYATTAASPWDPPMCTDPSTSPVGRGSVLGSFAAARANLDFAVSVLQRAHADGRRDLAAEQQAKDALARLRFHPREVALDPRVEEQSARAKVLLAAQLLTSEPDLAQTWAQFGLARHGSSPRKIHAFAHDLDPEVEQLYIRAQKSLDVATMALIRINCDSGCVAFVDGESISIDDGYAEVDLMPGTHDVWVFDEDRPDRGSFEAIELDAAEQRCVIFSPIDQALPTRAQWWAATEFADELRWALSCKSNVLNCPPQTLQEVAKRWTKHTLVLSRTRSLRTLLARGLLNFADLWTVTAQANPTAVATAAAQPEVAAPEKMSRRVAELEADASAGLGTPNPAAGNLNPAHDAIDTVLAMSRFDAGISATKIAAQLPPIRTPFDLRSRVAAADGGSIEIICHRSCWPTIMGVRVEEGAHAVAPGRYFVEIHSVTGDEPTVGGWLEVGEGGVAAVSFGPEPVIPAPVLASIDTGPPKFDRDQQFRRVALGTAGAISLTGGALWTLAIAAGMIPNHKIIDPESGTIYNLDPEQRLRLGLYMSGAFSVHAILATYLFVRMPPSQRPGMPLVAAGGGVIASSGVFAGVAIAGGVAAYNARSRMDDPGANTEVLRDREQSSIHTLIVGASATGALLISGGVTLGVGLHRAKHHQPMRSEQARPRVSNLRLSPSFGRELLGLRLAGQF